MSEARKWWRVKIDTGEYSFTYRVFARRVRQVDDDRFDKGFGLSIDGALVDFSWGITIDRVTSVPEKGGKS